MTKTTSGPKASFGAEGRFTGRASDAAAGVSATGFFADKQRPTPGQRVAFVWAHDQEAGVAVRDRLRLEGFKASLADEREWTPRAVYPCDVLVFVGARNQVEIEAAYSDRGFRGECWTMGLDGERVGATGGAPHNPAPEADSAAADDEPAEVEADLAAEVAAGVNAPAKSPKKKG